MDRDQFSELLFKGGLAAFAVSQKVVRLKALYCKYNGVREGPNMAKLLNWLLELAEEAVKKPKPVDVVDVDFKEVKKK